MVAALVHCGAEELAAVVGVNSVNIYSQIKMKIYWSQRVFGAAETAAARKRLSDSD